MIRGSSGESEEAVDSHPITVLYVDDHDQLCRLAEAGLQDASDRIQVDTTTDPSRVTELLDRYDCIVSDYRMPGTDGLELLRQVRVLDEDIPFILFTGHGSEGIASDAISLGVTDYLTKGGSRERFTRLANRIEGAVRAHRASEAVQRTKTRARDAIERERARFRALTEHSPSMLCVLDGAARYEYLSPSVEDMTGYRPRDLRGEVAFDHVHADDLDRIVAEFERSLSEPDYRPRVRYRFEHASGEWLHLESTGINRLEDPDVEGFIVNTRDVTEERRIERRLDRERSIAGGLLETMLRPTLILDEEGRVSRANRRAEEALETYERDLLGLSFGTDDHVDVLTTDGEPVAPDELAWTTAMGTGRRITGVEYVLLLPSGRFEVAIDVVPARGADPTAAVVSLQDVEPL